MKLFRDSRNFAATNIFSLLRLIASLRFPLLVILNFENSDSFLSSVSSAVSFLVEVVSVLADWGRNFILVNDIDVSAPLGVLQFPLLLLLIFDSESSLSAVSVVSEVSFLVEILSVIADCGRFVLIGLGIIGFVARKFSAG